MLNIEEIAMRVTDWLFKQEGRLCGYGTLDGPFCDLIRGEVSGYCEICPFNTTRRIGPTF